MRESINEISTFIALMLAGAVFFTIPAYFLWNWLMPDIFGLPKIDFFQTFGLMILSGLLFKNTSFPMK